MIHISNCHEQILFHNLKCILFPLLRSSISYSFYSYSTGSDGLLFLLLPFFGNFQSICSNSTSMSPNRWSSAWQEYIMVSLNYFVPLLSPAHSRMSSVLRSYIFLYPGFRIPHVMSIY